MPVQVRTDKWLWAVRIFKTRTMATEACRKGHVTIDGIPVKPSRMIHAGEVVKVRKPPIYRSYRIIEPAEKRMGAGEVPRFIEDITPVEEIERLEMQRQVKGITREKGTGRPTKKERRDLENFLDL